MIEASRKLLSRYRGELFFFAANYTTPLVGLWTSAITAAFLDPEELGGIQQVLLILPYMAFLQLGVFNGLNRNLAFYMGRSDMATAQRMINATSFMANLVSGVGLCVGISIIAAQAWGTSIGSISTISAIALTVALVFEPQNQYMSSLFRSGQHFKVFGRLVIIENSFRFAYSALPIVLGWVGRVLALSIKSIVGFILRWKAKPYSVSGDFMWADIKELLHAGTPLLISGYLWTLLLVADQSLIAIYFSKTDLGYYTLSRLLVQAMMVVPVTMAVVLYPKASALYGSTGNSLKLRPFFWKSLGFNIIFFTPICLLAYFLLNSVVDIFLPKYGQGVSAAKINIITCFTFISCGPGVIPGVLKKNMPVAVINGIGLFAIWQAGRFLCTRSGTSIETIAWLRLYIAGLTSTLTVLYSFLLTTSFGKRIFSLDNR